MKTWNYLLAPLAALLAALNAESSRGISQVRRAVGHVKSHNPAYVNAMTRGLIECKTLQVHQGAHR